MTLCGTCDEWFHHTCVGLDEASAAASVNWECGWCKCKPDKDGKCVWSLPLIKDKKGVDRAVRMRHSSQTPRALGIDPGEQEKLDTWEKIVGHCRTAGKKLNLDMAKKRVKAAALVKEAGHHVGDEMIAGGLQVRAVDDRLVNDFMEQGLIDSGSEDDDE